MAKQLHESQSFSINTQLINKSTSVFFNLYDLDFVNNSPTWVYPAPNFPILFL